MDTRDSVESGCWAAIPCQFSAKAGSYSSQPEPSLSKLHLFKVFSGAPHVQAERHKKTDRKPLELTELRLRDYRCFEAIDIDFHPQLTVLVAANGAGKTSILDAIAVAFGPYVGAFDEAVGKHFEPSDIRQFQVRRTATNEMEYAPKGLGLKLLLLFPTAS
ncbi:ATP-binding protein [Pseudomonas aeruginosa]|nr:ATP-binding protein [Pseudomonas aeruginosa]